jgi:hypothetical protein
MGGLFGMDELADELRTRLEGRGGTDGAADGFEGPEPMMGYICATAAMSPLEGTVFRAVCVVR